MKEEALPALQDVTSTYDIGVAPYLADKPFGYSRLLMVISRSRSKGLLALCQVERVRESVLRDNFHKQSREITMRHATPRGQSKCHCDIARVPLRISRHIGWLVVRSYGRLAILVYEKATMRGINHNQEETGRSKEGGKKKIKGIMISFAIQSLQQLSLGCPINPAWAHLPLSLSLPSTRFPLTPSSPSHLPH